MGGLSMDECEMIVRAVDIARHPLMQADFPVRAQYLNQLTLLVHRYCDDRKTADYILERYRNGLIGDQTIGRISKKSALFRYRFCLICDAIFMCALLDPKKGAAIINVFKCQDHRSKSDRCYKLLLHTLYGDRDLKQALRLEKIRNPSIGLAWKLVRLVQEHKKQLSQPLRHIMITATMSAGKSTLINALFGKKLMRTSQEACTGHICKLYHKPFEDHTLELLASDTQILVDHGDIMEAQKAGSCSISVHGRFIDRHPHRLCLIDTPGVDSALEHSHGAVTRQALTAEMYDKLVFVFAADQLGKDAVIAHLQYIADTVPHDKIIFVVSKLDLFKSKEDSITESVQWIREDLRKVGFENPLICPVSAYFALLLKLHHAGETLDEDELDEYEMCVKKFHRAQYDLSGYYGTAPKNSTDEYESLCNKCGMTALEKIIME